MNFVPLLGARLFTNLSNVLTALVIEAWLSELQYVMDNFLRPHATQVQF